MSNPRPRAAIAAAITLALAASVAPVGSIAGSGEPAPAGMPTFVPTAPDDSKAGAAALRGETWVHETPYAILRMQMLDPAERLAYIRHVTGTPTDPFASPPDQPERFITFVLELENPGEGQLSFNPGSTWLISNREWDNQSPLGVTDLSFMYRSAGREFPAAYENVGKTLLTEPVLLDPGRSTAGLLVFRAVHPKTKWLRLQPVLVLSSGDIVRLSAPYERLEPEKKKKKSKKKPAAEE